MLTIDERTTIDEAELEFTFSRSGGPGGQHVNRTESRVTLSFDVAGSPSLDDATRARLLGRLATRINKNGVLRMHCQVHRSQAANRAELVERFVEVVRGALKRRKRRRATRPGQAAVERRLEAKSRRAAVKRTRSKPGRDD